MYWEKSELAQVESRSDVSVECVVLNRLLGHHSIGIDLECLSDWLLPYTFVVLGHLQTQHFFEAAKLCLSFRPSAQKVFGHVSMQILNKQLVLAFKR